MEAALPQPTPRDGIKWHEVTWYSKLGALILFVGVVPAFCLYIGMQYQSVLDLQQDSSLSKTPVTIKPQVQTDDPYPSYILGHYENGNSYIDISPIDEHSVHVTGEAVFEPQNSTGVIDFIAPVLNSHIHSVGSVGPPDSGKSGCIVDLFFKKHVPFTYNLEVTNNYHCNPPWGSNVEFEGLYKKSSQ